MVVLVEPEQLCPAVQNVPNLAPAASADAAAVSRICTGAPLGCLREEFPSSGGSPVVGGSPTPSADKVSGGGDSSGGGMVGSNGCGSGSSGSGGTRPSAYLARASGSGTWLRAVRLMTLTTFTLDLSISGACQSPVLTLNKVGFPARSVTLKRRRSA